MNPILIYAYNRHSFGGLFAVLEQLERCGHDRVFITTSDRSVQSYSEQFREDLPQRFLPLAETLKYCWAAILSTHLPPASLSRNGPLMIVPHGSGHGIGGAYSDVLASNCSVYFGHDPGELQSLVNRLGNQFPIDRFVAPGAPHTDAYARYVDQAPEERGQLKRELGLDPQLPVILVTSHWTPDSILRTWGPAALAALEPFSDRFSIVQIAHRLIWDYPEYDTYDPRKDHVEKLEKFDSAGLFLSLNDYCKLRARMHFLPNVDTWKALAVADLLIGDYSSIIIEYCVLDRPVVFSNHKHRFFDPVNYQRYAAACGAADSVEQLAAVVEDEWHAPQQRSAARRALANAFIWNFGNAAATVAGEILKRI